MSQHHPAPSADPHAAGGASATTVSASDDPSVNRLAHETLRLLGPAPDNWVPPRAGVDHNVLVVGAGQNGIAFAHALRRAGVGQVSVIDAAPSTALTGGWRTRARMPKLRTLKTLVGPELGLPTLGFQAWYEASHGREAYAAIDRIPRLAWADYLDWYRAVLQVPVRHDTRLEHIEPATDSDGLPLLQVTLRVAGGTLRRERTRHLILANGVAGAGAPAVPDALVAARAAGLAWHTADAFDTTRLQGRRVAVVGAAASAFDAAAVALDAGASAVHLFARRTQLPATPVIRGRSYPGIYDHYSALPDATRWHHAVRYRRLGSTAPADSIANVVQDPRFVLHLGATWTAARVLDGQVLASVQTADGLTTQRFDQVIAGTGYHVDLSLRPELSAVAPHVLRWADRYSPPADERDEALGLSPYLGQGLELQERVPGQAPWLRLIHLYNPGGFVSSGWPLGDVPTMRRDIPAVVSHISRALLLADLPQHEARTRAPVAEDFGPALYAAAVRRAQGAATADGVQAPTAQAVA